MMVIKYNIKFNTGVVWYGILDKDSFSSVTQSCPTFGLQYARLPCLSPIPRACSNLRDAIQSSHSLLSPSPPAFNLSQHLDPGKKWEDKWYIIFLVVSIKFKKKKRKFIDSNNWFKTEVTMAWNINIFRSSAYLVSVSPYLSAW